MLGLVCHALETYSHPDAPHGERMRFSIALPNQFRCQTSKPSRLRCRRRALGRLKPADGLSVKTKLNLWLAPR
jgi:hypothetical protein